MSEETFNRQECINAIREHLHRLNERDLEHIEHVVTTLHKSKDGSMHYFGKFLGIERQGENMIMNLGRQHENTYGVVQGGALYSLADIAIGFFIKDMLKEGEKVYTLELKLNFIKKGKGSQLIAKPRIIQWGDRILVSECSIYDDQKDLIAQGLGTFYISKAQQRGGRK